MLAASYAEAAKAKNSAPNIGKADIEDIKIISPDLVVKNGPFKGMSYNGIDSMGSVLIPKLLGSYEREIQRVIEEICCESYSTVFNIGCGEGYYAVGFAFRNPGIQVFAYDVQAKAQELCSQLAQVNGVGSRVFVQGACFPETLKSFHLRERSLIFCDCEGFEKELFTTETIQYLKGCDLLIELHDCYDITISSHISDLFKETHEQIFIESIDDIQKAITYDYPEIRGLDLNTKKRLLAENRLAIMQWVVLKAKLNAI